VIFINHCGSRKAKRIGDRDTALSVARAIRERIARGDLNLAPRPTSKRSEPMRTVG